MLSDSTLAEKVGSASRWSLLTEIASKVMPPITNTILARLLTPEAFGMVATVTMVTSFAEVFADAGFQKYIVQKDFQDEEELNCSTNVAFWTNLGISLLLWIFIFLFRDLLAKAVGNPGLGNALAVSAISLPLVSFSSIQMARFRRDFEFKTLFEIRLITIFIPMIVTIPLAFLLRNFWAIIIGNIIVYVSNAIVVMIRAPWNPSLFFSIEMLKNMFSFSGWLLIERLLGWANLNVGIFLVGRFLSDYYLGIYKTSMAYANQVIGIIISAFSPVLLSALSRLKDDEKEFNTFFYEFERSISIVIIPLGIGIFVYRDLFTEILLGGQWAEAANFIGLWALLRSLQTVFGMFSAEVFVAKGKPYLGAVEQLLTLLVLIPTLAISAKKGYEVLYLARCLVVFWAIVEEMILLKIAANISLFKIAKSSLPYLVTSILMGILGHTLIGLFEGYVWLCLSILICILFYFGNLLIFSTTRQHLLSIVKSMKRVTKLFT